MLFCEMLWEGVPVFVRRFDRTGFHPAFTIRDGPLTIPPSGRPDPVTISNPLRSPGLPADRNEHLGRVSSDHPNAAVMDDVLPECRLVGKLVGPFDAVG